MNSKKPLLLSIAVLTLVGFMVLTLTQITKKPNVLLEMSPTTATIYVDNKKVKVFNGGILISKGTHQIVVKQTGFTDFRSEIVVSDSNQSLTVLLEPNSEAGFTFLTNNPDEQLRREGIIGRQSGDTSERLSKANPVTSILPYIDQFFRIDYGTSKKNPNDPNSIGIYITEFGPNGKEKALNLLKSKGFDPLTLEIIYR